MNTILCPTCNTPIPAHAPGGFCPACILRDAAELPPPGRAAPSLAEVSNAFPQLEVLELIGQGGMGFVYKARQPSLDRTVALKILSPELSHDPAFSERFAREARVLGKLNHPNIVTVFESGESGGFFYLIMEHVDGVNLRQAMRAGRFTPQQALAVVPGICDALQAAHAQGIWHRDIKPENILLDAPGGVKIVDFGIARLVGDPRRDFTLTMTGAALGSVAYMAPEQHEKPHDVDHRADIYSLGVVIYEMLTGELPLGRFPAPSARAAVDARIDEIVFRTLEKEREMRQQSAEEVKTDVTRAASGPARVKVHERQTESPFGLPKPLLWSVALLLAGLVIGGTGWFIFANLREARASGAVVAGLGALALIFGLIGSIWSLVEMKRGAAPATGRKLLIGLVVVPAAIACVPAALGSALATGVPAIKGSILVLAALIIVGLGIAFSLIFKLARPLSEPTPLRRKLARASLLGSALALVACAVVAKRSDYTWPHVFYKETATLSLNRDAKPADDELLALLKKAAGPQVTSLELSAKNGRATVTALSTEFRPYMGGSVLTVEKGSHAQACLARLRDLLPAAAIHYSQINAQIPFGVFESGFASGRIPIAILAILGTLLATLAGGRHAVKVIGAGIALHLILIAAPAWENPRVVEGAPLPMFKAADITLAPDFSTPDKAVTSVYDAACWGNREVARRGMSKALAAGLDAQDGWDEFFERNAGRRMVATLWRNAKPDRFYNQLQVQTSYINRTGTSTSGDHTWVVQEDGEWRLDQLTYVGRNGEITAPATWFAKKKAADAAKVVTPPEPEVALAAPQQPRAKVVHKVGIFPGDRLVLDGKAVGIDELTAFLKQWVEKDELEGIGVHIEKGSDAAFARKVHKLLMDSGVHFDAEAMRAFNETPVVGGQSIPSPIAAEVPSSSSAPAPPPLGSWKPVNPIPEQTESPEPVELIYRMNELANAKNAAGLRKYLPAKNRPNPQGIQSLQPPSDEDVSKHMRGFAGKVIGVWDGLPSRPPEGRNARVRPPLAAELSPSSSDFALAGGPTAVVVVGPEKQYGVELERANGSREYFAVVFEWRKTGRAFSRMELLPYVAKARVEFRPAQGDPKAILSDLASEEQVTQVFANGEAVTGQFDIRSPYTRSPDVAVKSANELIERITADLKKVGSGAAFRIISTATPPEKPAFFSYPNISPVVPKAVPAKADAAFNVEKEK